MTEDGSYLLAGPRGRRLVWTLLGIEPPAFGDAWLDAWRDLPDLDADALVRELDQDAITVRIEPVVAGLDGRLLPAFADSVTWARYWQEPDGIDRALAVPGVTDALRGVADLVEASAPGWWTAALDPHDQWLVDRDDPGIPATTVVGAAAKIAAWRADIAADEKRSADRPRSLATPWSGYWWSAPCMSTLPTTTRALPGEGPIGLHLVEDDLGWTQATCRRVVPVGQPHVFEIAEAMDWVALVKRYPLDVTLSRRHDWWRAVGVDSAWLIPDYAAVCADYDAVHLTAHAYLQSAGVPLAVGAAHTVIAGWNPDQTYWLTDCLEPVGAPQAWWCGEDDGRHAWAPAD